MEILTGKGFAAGRYAKRAPAVKEKPAAFSLARIVSSAKLLLVYDRSSLWPGLSAPLPQHSPRRDKLLHQPRRRQFQKPAPIGEVFVLLFHNHRAQQAQPPFELSQLAPRQRIVRQWVWSPGHGRILAYSLYIRLTGTGRF